MKIPVYFKNKKIIVDVKKTGFISKGLGLTFRTRNTKNLLFEFPNSVTWEGNLTSIFVFFKFLVIWLDNKNKVIDFRIAKPFEFCIKQRKKFHKIIEIPINNKNKGLIVRFIGKTNYFDLFDGNFFTSNF